MTDITPPPPHLLKKFSAQAQDEAKKRNGAGYLKTFATLCIEWAMNSQTTPNDRQIRSSEITPPPEMVAQIRRDALHGSDGQLDYELKLIHDAYRAGADQELQLDAERINQAWQKGADYELEACCDHIRDYQWGFVDRPDGTKMHRAVDLELARRPKPPSLKEQALKAVQNIDDACESEGFSRGDDTNIIRRALESLPD